MKLYWWLTFSILFQSPFCSWYSFLLSISCPFIFFFFAESWLMLLHVQKYWKNLLTLWVFLDFVNIHHKEEKHQFRFYIFEELFLQYHRDDLLCNMKYSPTFAIILLTIFSRISSLDHIIFYLEISNLKSYLRYLSPVSFKLTIRFCCT
jgi:hypothetical protein